MYLPELCTGKKKVGTRSSRHACGKCARMETVELYKAIRIRMYVLTPLLRRSPRQNSAYIANTCQILTQHKAKKNGNKQGSTCYLGSVRVVVVITLLMPIQNDVWDGSR